MLISLLIASISMTAFCVWAEAHPPTRKVVAPTATPVQVTMETDEDDPTDDDADPPTVVQTRPG